MSNSATDFGEWPLRRLLSAVVGSGPKSAEDMTREQAREVFARILAGEPDPTTLGAFWLANRWKRNTPEELAAYVDVMREESVETAVPDADPVDCGANYDGKTETALLGVAAGLVAAAAGTPVVVHSGDRVPTLGGDAYRHVLDALDVETDLSPAESAAMVDDVGFGYYDQAAANPGVAALCDRREQMGVRTFVNTIETLANPADAAVHLGSFYHLSFAVRIIETLRNAETQPVGRVLMFQGLEGYDDVRPGSTVVAEWGSLRDSGPASEAETDPADGEAAVTDFEIETAEYGMDFESEDLEVDDVAADSAAITEAVLAGERDDAFADAVALNAALRMYAREDVPDLAAGLARARETIDGGAAAAALDALRAR
ncbi:MAG: anthranilate phosphoribosyltransferase [Haloarculaceae archaeon]